MYPSAVEGWACRGILRWHARVFVALTIAFGCTKTASETEEASSASPVAAGSPAAEARPANSAPQASAPIEPGLLREPRHSVQVQEAMGRLAIPFQQNVGQWERSVAFKADHFAGSLWVTRRGELVYSLLGPELASVDSEGATPTAPVRNNTALADEGGSRPVVAPPHTSQTGVSPNGPGTSPHRERGPGWTLTEEFVGGRPRAPRGLAASPTNVSYFIGDDESKWAPHVSTFGAVTLGEVWPGIEVRLVAHGNNIEKFFHVRAGTSPERIQMHVNGGADLRITEDGALRLTTGNGDVELSPPVAYQVIDGARREVSVRYEVSGAGYGFVVGDYDRSKELVIDPILQSTFLGGASFEYGLSGCIGAGGEVIVAGVTQATGYPGLAGGAQSSFGGIEDIVVSRLSADLATLLQSTYLGGASNDQALSVATRSNGEIVVAGGSRSTDFPARTGGAQPTNAGGLWDIVVARLNSSLTSVLQSTYLGTSTEDFGYVVRENASGELLVAGSTMSTGFPGRTGGAQTVYGGGSRDVVLARFAGDLRSIIQTTYFGGNSDDGLNVAGDASLTIAPNGEILIAGSTNGTTLPSTAGAAQPSKAPGCSGAGCVDFFVARIAGDLRSFVRATFLGGAGTDYAEGITVLTTGEVIVVGSTTSTDFPATSSGVQVTNAGAEDMIVAKLNSGLTSLVQSTYVGTSGSDSARVVAQNSNGELVVAGYAGATGFPGIAGGAQSTFRGGSVDMAVVRLTSNLQSILQSTYVGDTTSDHVNQLAFDTGGHLVLFGRGGRSAFPGLAGGAQSSWGGEYDVAVVRLTGDLLGCDNDNQCLTSTALNVPNPVGGPIFPGRPSCNTTTRQCTTGPCAGQPANAQPVGCNATNDSDGNPCSIPACNGSGACSQTQRFAASTTACTDSDGNACTLARCTGTSTACNQSGGSAVNGTPCATDSNDCTSDVCNGAGACTHPNVAAGTSCASDGNPCTTDACNGSGTCTYTNVADGTACAGGTCTAGTCVPSGGAGWQTFTYEFTATANSMDLVLLADPGNAASHIALDGISVTGAGTCSFVNTCGPTTCSPPNPLSNGSMNAAAEGSMPNGWTMVAGAAPPLEAFSRTPSVFSADGGFALRLASSTIAVPPRGVSQTVTGATPGAVYRLSFYEYLSPFQLCNAASTCLWGTSLLIDGSVVGNTSRDPVSSPGWLLRTMSFTAPASSFALELAQYSNGFASEVLIDGVSLSCAPTTPTNCLTDATCNDGNACTTDTCQTSGALTIPNPSFNTASPSQWFGCGGGGLTGGSCPVPSMWGQLVAESPASVAWPASPDGGNIMRFPSGVLGSNAGAQVTVATTAGSNYTFTFYHSISNFDVGQTSAALRVSTINPGTGLAYGTPTSFALTNPGGIGVSPWIQRTVTFTGSPTTTSTILRFETIPNIQSGGYPKNAIDGFASLTGGQCLYGSAGIPGCCTTDAECADSNVCTATYCNLSTNRCVVAADPAAPGGGCTTGCCNTNADCNDGNACTTESCNVATNCCVRSTTVNCCTPSTPCPTPGGACQASTCSSNSDAVAGTCSTGTIAGCCTGAPGDCNDSNACTTDMCSLGGANLIVNGNFSTYNGDGTFSAPWVSGGVNSVGAGNYPMFPSPPGAKIYTHIEQTFATTAGRTYNLSFRAGSGYPGLTVNVTAGPAATGTGDLSASFAAPDFSQAVHTTTFVASSASTRIRFTNSATPGDPISLGNGIVIDDVSVSASAGCSNAAISCSDGNVCTNDTCIPATGCSYPPVTPSAPTSGGCCTANAQCNDGDACTTDACTGNVCVYTAIGGCAACTTVAQCPDDGNACTIESCNNPTMGNMAGTCQRTNAAAGFTCRAATGECDVAETCAGGGVACPANAFVGAGTVCTDSDGNACTQAACNGSGTCNQNQIFTTTTCRASTGACDPAESCSMGSCPADTFSPANTIVAGCTEADGNVCTQAACNGAGACNQSQLFTTAVCRVASGGGCDVAESCTGSSSVCPANGFATAGTTCRGVAGGCDVAETCSGSSDTCPVDGFALAGTTCRSVAGVCDVAETCSGSAAACPADGFLGAATQCRAAVAGGCDVAENCSGSAASCPADLFVAANTACSDTDGNVCTSAACNGSGLCNQNQVFTAATCRASAGGCDVAETCSAGSCPADGFASAGTTCRAPSAACDTAETCAGGTATCPPDVTTCTPCTGLAAGAQPAGCNLANDSDGNPCTQPACDGTGVCRQWQIAVSGTCRASLGACDTAETCTVNADQVETVAGSSAGFTNATGTSAQFNTPRGAVASPDGSVLYIADTANHRIRQVNLATGAVTTLAGTGTAGNADNTTATSATFNGPRGLAIDASGNLFVADTGSGRIRRIDASGTRAVTSCPTTGATSIRGLAVTSDGATVYWVEGNIVARRTWAGCGAAAATILAGSGTASYVNNATGTSARFRTPTGIALNAAGTALYVADTLNHAIRLVSLTAPYAVSTFVGATTNTSGTTDGTGTAARFNRPEDLTFVAGGDLVVADTLNHRIRRITAAGVVTTVSGSSAGSVNGAVTSATFSSPAGISDVGSNVYVIDTGNHRVRVIRDDGGTCPADVTAAANSTPAGCAAADDTDGNPCTSPACNGSGLCNQAQTFTVAVCRASAGICDIAESCTGSSATCPADTFVAGGTTCRMASGVCDVAESCTGSAAACPVDSFVAANSIVAGCTDSDGNTCTTAACNGSGTCSQSQISNNGSVCRAAAGICDVAEVCVGTVCPADSFAPMVTTCRTAANVCDPAETCSGAGALCPADVSSGSCPPGGCVADGDCDDSNSCTTNRCVSNVCVYAQSAGCCNNITPCSDGNLCTTDSCSSATAAAGTCSTGAIAACCTTGTQCQETPTDDQCTADSCSYTGTTLVTNGSMTMAADSLLPPTGWSAQTNPLLLGTGSPNTVLGYGIATQVTSASADGGRFAYVRGCASENCPTGSGNAPNGGFAQTLSGLTVGRNYQVSLQYFVTSNASPNWYVEIHLNGDPVRRVQPGSVPAGWQTLQVDAIATAATMSVRLIANARVDAAAIAFDGVSAVSAGGCSRSTVAGCCNSANACPADALFCTNHICSVSDLSAGTCSNTVTPGCCDFNSDCRESPDNQCSVDTCNAATHTCSRTWTAGCCNTDRPCAGDSCNVCSVADATSMGTCSLAPNCCNSTRACVDDGNVCTVESCSSATAAAGTCGTSTTAGCCTSDADCADADVCTANVCNLATNTCNAPAAIANCCTNSGQCNDGNACTTDSCNLATNQCEVSVIVGCGCALPGAGLPENGIMDGGTASNSPTGWSANPRLDGTGFCAMGNTANNAGAVNGVVANFPAASMGSSNFMHITVGTPNCPGTVTVQQQLNGLTPNSTYRVTFQYRNTSFNPSTVSAPTLTVRMSTTNLQVFQSSFGAWTTGVVTFTAPASGTGILAFIASGGGNLGEGAFAIDNVALSCSPACTTDAQCADANVCTSDVCVNGQCTNSYLSTCCNVDAECLDGNGCTNDQCIGNVCDHDPITNCCNYDMNCNDNNNCTLDTCDTSTNTCCYNIDPNNVSLMCNAPPPVLCRNNQTGVMGDCNAICWSNRNESPVSCNVDSNGMMSNPNVQGSNIVSTGCGTSGGITLTGTGGSAPQVDSNGDCVPDNFDDCPGPGFFPAP